MPKVRGFEKFFQKNNAKQKSAYDFPQSKLVSRPKNTSGHSSDKVMKRDKGH